MKVVVNRCYGGFGLSTRAIQMCYERGMTKLAYSIDEYFRTDEKAHQRALNIWNKYLAGDTSLEKKSEFTIFTSDKTQVLMMSSMGQERNNPILVSVVEELGKEANDSFSKLEIKEIPDDVKWEIVSRYGMEEIRKVSRNW